MILLVSVAFFPVQEDGNYSQPNYIHFIPFSPTQLNNAGAFVHNTANSDLCHSSEGVCPRRVLPNFLLIDTHPLYGISL